MGFLRNLRMQVLELGTSCPEELVKSAEEHDLAQQVMGALLGNPAVHDDMMKLIQSLEISELTSQELLAVLARSPKTREGLQRLILKLNNKICIPEIQLMDKLRESA
jgi:hypothetical protein